MPSVQICEVRTKYNCLFSMSRFLYLPLSFFLSFLFSLHVPFFLCYLCKTPLRKAFYCSSFNIGAWTSASKWQVFKIWREYITIRIQWISPTFYNTFLSSSALKKILEIHKIIRAQKQNILPYSIFILKNLNWRILSTDSIFTYEMWMVFDKVSFSCVFTDILTWRSWLLHQWNIRKINNPPSVAKAIQQWPCWTDAPYLHLVMMQMELLAVHSKTLSCCR